jgi:hypothetical protein
VAVVEVPELQFLMIDGAIEPGAAPANSSAFKTSIGALYSVAYGLKFMSKLRDDNPLDFTVMALEGLWADPATGFDFDTSQPWPYTLVMLQPDHIDQKMFDEAVDQAARKRPNPALGDLRLERWMEGLSIQTMHVGPYSEEAATIQQLTEFAELEGYLRRGRHHEIYLGDPTRAKPENLKTIIRHPVAISPGPVKP